MLKKQLDDAATKFGDMGSKDVPALNAALTKAKLEPLKVLAQDDWNKKQQ